MTNTTTNRSIRLGVVGGDLVINELKKVGREGEAALGKVEQGSSKTRGAIGQLSLQLQDVAVQIGGGASPFVILAQQGSQIASIFGPGGAVFGAVLAVAGLIGGTLVAALTGASSASKDAVSTTDMLARTFADSTSEIDKYRQQIVSATTSVRQLILAQVDLAARNRQGALDSTTRGLSDAAVELEFGRAPDLSAPGMLQFGGGPGAQSLQRGGDIRAELETAIKSGRGKDAVIEVIARLGLTGTLTDRTYELIAQAQQLADAFAIDAAVRRTAEAANNLGEVQGPASPFSSEKTQNAIESLQTRLLAVRNRGAGLAEQALSQLPDNVTDAETAKIRELAEAIADAEKARTADTKATRDGVAAQQQATGVIDELLRRLGKFEDSRGAFIKSFTNRLRGGVSDTDVARIRALAGDLFDTEQQAQIDQRNNQAIERQKRYAEQYQRVLEEDYRARQRLYETDPSAGAGLSRGLRDIIAETEDLGRTVQDSVVSAFNEANDAIVQFVTTGKLEFKSLANSIISDLARIGLQMAERRAISWVASLFGGAGATAGASAGSTAAASSAASGSQFFGLYHSGGAIGSPSGYRAIDPMVFAGAPRMHSGGLLADEVPIIAQRGETVLNRAQSAEYERGGATTVNVSIDARGSSDPTLEARLRRDMPRYVAAGLDQQQRRRPRRQVA